MIRYSKTACLFAFLICVCGSISISVGNSAPVSTTSAIHLDALHDSAIKSEPLINQPQLRSAYLLRLRGKTDRQALRNADSIRLELLSHFDVVLELLEQNNEQSIELALDRPDPIYGNSYAPRDRNSNIFNTRSCFSAEQI